MVAIRGVLAERRDGLVRVDVGHADDGAIGRGQTGLPKPYQDVSRFGLPSWPRPASSSRTKSTGLLTMGNR